MNNHDDERLSLDMVKALFERFNRRQRGEYIVECRNLYETTDNPLWVWDAWRLCRKYAFPIPEWIFEYFDRSANNLLDLANGIDPLNSKEIPRHTTEAIGFSSLKNTQGKRSKYKDYIEQKKRVLVVYEVWIVENGFKSGEITCPKGENRFTIAADNINGAWEKWKVYFEAKKEEISPKTVEGIYYKETEAMKERIEYVKKHRLPDGSKPSRSPISLSE